MLIRTIVILLVVQLASPQLFAQEEEFDDLLILYVDGDYEKLIRKAEKYSEDDDTRRDPRPYLYMSKAYYGMSKDEKYAEEYPKAFRDALKYASRYARKDDEREYWDINIEFINELRAEAMREADLYLSDDDRRGLSKAARLYRYLTDIDPGDPGAGMMYGAMLYKVNRRGEADRIVQEIGPKLPNIDMDDLSEDQKEMLKFGTIHFSQFLKEQGMLDSARVTMNIIHPYFENDNEFQLAYDEIQN